MEKLYMKTKKGNVPIDPFVAAKYNLAAGEEAPFSGDTIVDARGRAPEPEAPAEDRHEWDSEGELINDEIAQIDNGITLSQSEIIDFGQGTDSSNR